MRMLTLSCLRVVRPLGTPMMGRLPTPKWTVEILRTLRSPVTLCLIPIGLFLLLAFVSVSPVSTMFSDQGSPALPPGQPSGPPPDKPKHPRLDSGLNKLVDQIRMGTPLGGP